MQIETFLERLRSERADLKSQIADLHEALGKIEATITGIEFAMERIAVVTENGAEAENRDEAQAPAPSAPPTTGSGQWAGLPRTDALRRFLASASVPMSPTQIAKELQALGRKDSAEAVGRTLNYLSTHGEAVSKGYGQWVLVDKVPAAEPDEESEGRLALVN